MKNLYTLLILGCVFLSCQKTLDYSITEKGGYKYPERNTRIVGNNIYSLNGQNLSVMSVPSGDSTFIAKLPNAYNNDLVFDIDNDFVYYTSSSALQNPISKLKLSNPTSTSKMATSSQAVVSLQVNDQYVFELEMSLPQKIYSINKITNARTEIISDANRNDNIQTFEADNDYVYYIDMALWLKQYNLKTKETDSICKVNAFPTGYLNMTLNEGYLLIPQKDYTLSVKVPATAISQPKVVGPGTYYYSYGKSIFKVIYRDYTGNSKHTPMTKCISDLYAYDPADGSIRFKKNFLNEDYYISGFYGIAEDNNQYYIATNKGIVTLSR